MEGGVVKTSAWDIGRNPPKVLGHRIGAASYVLCRHFHHLPSILLFGTNFLSITRLRRKCKLNMSTTMLRTWDAVLPMYWCMLNTVCGHKGQRSGS